LALASLERPRQNTESQLNAAALSTANHREDLSKGAGCAGHARAFETAEDRTANSCSN
jgi:hypothetical protein